MENLHIHIKNLVVLKTSSILNFNQRILFTKHNYYIYVFKKLSKTLQHFNNKCYFFNSGSNTKKTKLYSGNLQHYL